MNYIIQFISDLIGLDISDINIFLVNIYMVFLAVFVFIVCLLQYIVIDYFKILFLALLSKNSKSMKNNLSNKKHSL
ncbi:hypothetical protein [Spiroplasma helicoides]|nr:hypothetical protein [Spiroplasma helicoides]